MPTSIYLKEIIFERNNKKILKKINWNIQDQENWVLLGKNGSGKTSLINIIYGYHWPTSGEVEIFGKKFGDFPLKEIRNKIGILEASHQESRLQRNLTVREIIASGLLGTIGIYKNISKREEEIVDTLLESNKWIQNPNQNFETLSSGEKKKVLLLRSLINEPDILILDEPCSSLDIHSREDFFNLLNENYKKRNFQSILITHRTDEIPSMFSNVLMLSNGEMICSGKIEDCMNDENLSKTYELDIHVEKISNQYICTVIRNN